MGSRRTILITGASGNLGAKLRAHFGGLGYELRLVCLNPAGDPDIRGADLSVYDEGWAALFEGVDTVLHLAGDRRSAAPWDSIQRLNVDLTLNVLRAAVAGRVRRFVFASSNWVMGGYRFGTERLTTAMPPWPINPYGNSKLFGERAGRAVHEQHGMSFIGFRIGYCQPDRDNRPGPHMMYSSWGQQMWLSDRDLCHGMERAIEAEGIGFSVLNLMSDNPGMRWDIDETRRVIGYRPQDGHVCEMTDAMLEIEATAARARDLADRLNAFVVAQRS